MTAKTSEATGSRAEIDERNARIHGRSGRLVRKIEEFNKGLSPEARHEKYCKMAATPYALYRGTDHLFWMDFEWDWRLNRFGSYRTRTWINGDCHAYNFGAYDVHRVGVVYGLNDFDEAIIADYQYDLWRLAVSLVLIARENGDLSHSSQEKVIDDLAETYLETLARFVGNRKADETCYTSGNTGKPLKKFLAKVEKKKSRGKLLQKWTRVVEGETQFDLENERLDGIEPTRRSEIEAAMPAYIETIESDREFSPGLFKVKDVAKRLGAGTGSLGSDRYYVLIEGDAKSGDDDIILDVKQQSHPSAHPYATEPQLEEYAKRFPDEAFRHAVAYRALGFHPDDLLGSMKLGEDFFSVRERSPFKESFPTEELTSKKDFRAMAQHWGRGLATEHARADKITDYSLAKEVGELTDGKHSEFQAMVRQVAFGYADQVAEDWETFLKHLAPRVASDPKRVSTPRVPGT